MGRVAAVTIREIAAFAGAGFLVLLFTPWVRALAVRVGAVDVPDDRRVHDVPTPRLGGLAMVAAFVLTLVVAGHGIGLGQPLQGVVAGGLFMAAVGAVDDMVELPAYVKFLGQLMAAGITVSWGVRITWVTNPLGGMFQLGDLSVPLTILWIVAVTNVINIVDGLDGLAAGISGIAAMTMLAVAAFHGAVGVALLSAILAGVTMGFLRYNFHPATIFMGDAGSMFLGYMIAAISVVGTLKYATTVAIAVPIVALGLPIFDTAFAIVRRALAGQAVSTADRGHLHHRLLELGLSQRQVALLLYTVTAALAFSGFLLSQVSLRVGAAALGVVLGLFFGGAQSLGLLKMPQRAARDAAGTQEP
jgi:UDP-GlcNAc:undecaprenyl-phosphate GlcNAc-1-phosphate transferase